MSSTADISSNNPGDNTSSGPRPAGAHDGRNVYDVVVIGAGPAGENVAQYATQGSGLSAVRWACTSVRACAQGGESSG